MALIKGSNSYATVAEANNYFSTRLDVDAWNTASDEQKMQALVTATQSLDLLNWTGTAISDSQLLAFPRYGWYYDSKFGKYIELTEEVPDRIIKAVFELAYHLLNNDGILDDTGTLTSLSIGQISLTFKHEPRKIPSHINRGIRPLLLNQGTRMWWRAN
jgi:hypothetical protein